MSDQHIFEVPDFTKECEPFEFKIPGNDTVFKLRPLGLFTPEDMTALAKAQLTEDIATMVDLMGDNKETRAVLAKLPILAIKALAKPWREAAGLDRGES